MRNVLEHIRYLLVSQLRSQQVVVHLTQILIRIMIPGAGIAVQQSWSFDKLFASATSLALVCVVRVAKRVRVEFE